MAHPPPPPSGTDPMARSEPAVHPPVSMRPTLVGQTVDGRYVVGKILGEGGMGVVYEARHKVIGRRVALKVLRAEYVNDREILDRFILEAQSASAIGNPHIVDIFDFGALPDGSTYFAMEFLEGQALTKLVGTRPNPARLARIALQVCNGLGAAHDRGIVHRDLKPDNIFLLDREGADFVKILDFGIAKVSTNTAPKLTKMGSVFGTPHYMSPEQAAGTEVDARADIYSFGVILYELVAGQLPFDSDNFMGILTQHLYKAPAPIRSLPHRPECPPAFEAIIQKCLEKRVDRRYQDLSELGADLRRFLDGQAPLAVAELLSRANDLVAAQDYFQPTATPTSATRSSRALVLAGVSLALVAVAIGLFLAARRVEQRNADAKQVPAVSASKADPPTAGAANTASAAADAAKGSTLQPPSAQEPPERGLASASTAAPSGPSTGVDPVTSSRPGLAPSPATTPTSGVDPKPAASAKVAAPTASSAPGKPASTSSTSGDGLIELYPSKRVGH